MFNDPNEPLSDVPRLQLREPGFGDWHCLDCMALTLVTAPRVSDAFLHHLQEHPWLCSAVERADVYFRREVFPVAGPLPWLDRPDALPRIEREVDAGRLSHADAALARCWVKDGYVILPSFLSTARIEAVWAEYEAAIASGSVTPTPKPIPDDPFLGRLLNPHFKIPAVDAMLRDRAIQQAIGFLLGAEPLPFQTIIGHAGSQQHAHSDTIHMTSYPMGISSQVGPRWRTFIPIPDRWFTIPARIACRT